MCMYVERAEAKSGGVGVDVGECISIMTVIRYYWRFICKS